ncbi:MAG: PEGA domain-containing protein [Candidatus Cloacimonetes bacterium]|nr:PEGA domain-containing protein [Candidatus Cloacimonadota bacterium]
MIKVLHCILFLCLGFLYAQSLEVISFEIDNQDFHGTVYPVLDANGDNCALIRIEHNLSSEVHLADVEVFKREKKAENIYYFYISRHEQSVTLTTEKYLPIKYKFNLMLASGKVYVLQLFGSEEFKNDPVYKFEGKGDFSIISDPEGADISIDGISTFQEKTPFSLKDFKAGNYLISLAKYRYETVDTVIVIEKDEKNSLKIELSPLFGDLSVTSEPSGCIVLINGREKGVTPLYLTGANSGLDAGNYNIKVQKSGNHINSYGIYQEPIEIICGESVNIEAVLPAQYGSISLSSNNSKTKYEIVDLDTKESVYNGKNIEKLQLLTGSYKIKADNPDCLAKSKTIDVTYGSNDEVKFLYLESDYRVFLERKRNEQMAFRDFIYKDNDGALLIGEAALGFTFPDSLKSNTTLRIGSGEDFYFIQIPLLAKISFMGESKIALTGGVSVLGNISIATGSKLDGWIDLVSFNGGMIFHSENYRARLHIECDAGLKLAWTSFENTYTYQSQKITYCSLDFDSEGNRTLEHPWQWAPVDLSCTYEHHIGGRAFIMLRAGFLYFCIDGNDYYWYDKSAANAWETEGANKPEPIIGDDLPPVPYLEGFKPYFGIGIRF